MASNYGNLEHGAWVAKNANGVLENTYHQTQQAGDT